MIIFYQIQQIYLFLFHQTKNKYFIDLFYLIFIKFEVIFYLIFFILWMNVAILMILINLQTMNKVEDLFYFLFISLYKKVILKHLKRVNFFFIKNLNTKFKSF